MRILRNIFLFLVVLCVILFVVYQLGPKPEKPRYTDQFPALPNSPLQVKHFIDREEAGLHIKPGNAATVEFVDSLKKTPFAVVYLHGFSASHEEGMPLHTNFARRYHCNLYLSRLEGHGLADTPALKNLNAATLYRSAVKALAVGCKIGDSVILMGTSAGGALALMLAAREKKAPVKALILYSPCIKIFDPNAYLLDTPWGLQIAHLITGKQNVTSHAPDTLTGHYWYNSYRLEGAVALQRLLDDGMTRDNFKQVRIPVLTCMYYKDKIHQDSTVQTGAIRSMVADLGSANAEKPLVIIPNAGNHVIASYIKSHDLGSVRKATFSFADEVLHLPH